MKIVADKDIPYLEEGLKLLFGDTLELRLRKGRDIATADLRGAQVLAVRTRTRCDESLLRGSGVEVVATATAGTDHIDLDYCRRAGIRVVSAAGCNAPAVAQYVEETVGTHLSPPNLQSSEPPTVSIIGKGNIGGLLADRFRRAGRRVVVCDPPRAERGLTDEQYVSLPEALAFGDVVTFHVPLTFNGTHPTFHMLDAEGIAMLKPGAVVVNAARGGVIDEAAALSLRPDIRYIIDTWEMENRAGEPSPVDEAFVRRTLIATPHIAGYSIEGKRRATAMVLDGLAAIYGSETRPDSWSFNDTVSPQPQISFSTLTTLLKTNPSSFEELRSSYPLRHELGMRNEELGIRNEEFFNFKLYNQ